jgi:hypothetical protein
MGTMGADWMERGEWRRPKKWNKKKWSKWKIGTLRGKNKKGEKVYNKKEGGRSTKRGQNVNLKTHKRWTEDID